MLESERVSGTQKQEEERKTMAFERLLRSRAYSALPPLEKLDAMLRHKTFAQLLREGRILDVKQVVARAGYTRQHVYDLCRSGKIACITRGVKESEVQYFFLPEQVKDLFRARTVSGKSA